VLPAASNRDQEPRHLQGGGQLLGDLAQHVRLRPGAGHQAAAAQLLEVEDALHRLAGRRDEVERGDAGQVLEDPLLGFRQHALARGALGHHPEEGEARPDRAVQRLRLVLLQGQVLDEAAGRVLDLHAVAARADARQLLRRHAHRLAVEEDAAAGRLRPQAQGADRFLELHRVGVVVLRLRQLQRAARALVALAPQLDLVRADREVGDLEPVGGA
jgi:hypothetical protein